MSIEHPAQAADDTENDAAEELPSRWIATGLFAPDPEDQLRDARSFWQRLKLRATKMRRYGCRRSCRI